LQAAVKVHGSVGGRFFQGFVSNLLARRWDQRTWLCFLLVDINMISQKQKLLKVTFLSKPASLSERNHRKLKWSLKMPP